MENDGFRFIMNELVFLQCCHLVLVLITDMSHVHSVSVWFPKAHLHINSCYLRPRCSDGVGRWSNFMCFLNNRVTWEPKVRGGFFLRLNKVKSAERPLWERKGQLECESSWRSWRQQHYPRLSCENKSTQFTRLSALHDLYTVCKICLQGFIAIYSKSGRMYAKKKMWSYILKRAGVADKHSDTGRGLGPLEQTCVIASSVLEAHYITRWASVSFISISVCLECWNTKPEPEAICHDYLNDQKTFGLLSLLIKKLK